jgi:glyceraldehyde 3-phosphate dehydrogenase
MRIAINGMGRIGRLLFRRLLDQPELEIVAINDVMDIENLVYLIKYDSIYGTYPLTLMLHKNILHIGNKQVQLFNESNPLALPWKQLTIETVIECTGKFNNTTACMQHIAAGAKKVLLSTTGDAAMPLFIYGYNQKQLNNSVVVFSPGGCMTNCSVPVLDVLQTEIGVESGHLNFLHSYTSRQELVDAPNKVFRRGRAAAEAIIPVEVDQQQTLEWLMPSLKNKLAATSTRVPVANGAMADCSVVLKKAVTVKAINEIFKTAALGKYQGVLQYTEEQLVSIDIKNNPHSCIVDGTLTAAVNNHIKVTVWFDNEFGFTSRIIDWLIYWK